nr:MFS transporter [uncultured Lichenicoccus sp.]
MQNQGSGMSESLQDTASFQAAGEVAGEAAWPAVFSLALGVFSLVTAEFLPASLLTPMAATFGASEALVGQAVTVTAAAALVAALVAAVVTRGLDRRLVLMGFSVLLVASNLLVALAPDLTVLLLARVLLGAALGGFWSMATAVAMRLVPPALLPRALSMIFSGVSIATIVAAPLGAWLGHLFGWRSVFLLAMAIGVVTLLFQAATLPRLASIGEARLRTLADVLLRPGIGLGILCCVLVFGGHFALFTFIRPYLEDVADLGIDTMALVLLGFGIANFAGTLIAGLLLERSLRLTLTLMPLVIGGAALALAGLHARGAVGRARAADGAVGHGVRRGAGRLVDMARARSARRGGERRRIAGRGRAACHRLRRCRGRRDVRPVRRCRRLRRRRPCAAADRGADLFRAAPEGVIGGCRLLGEAYRTRHVVYHMRGVLAVIALQAARESAHGQQPQHTQCR